MGLKPRSFFLIGLNKSRKFSIMAMNRKQPFWQPASSYYVAAVAVGLVFFFLAWAFLQESGEGTPWVTAGIAASLLLVGSVVLRGVMVRRARMRQLRAQGPYVDLAQRVASRRGERGQDHRRLSIERNAAILGEIDQKSRAAKVLGKYSSGHREVVDMCAEYAVMIESELKGVRPGSTRLGPLLKGRSKVAELHKYHTLKWAEIEAHSLADEAHKSTNITGRIAAAENALEVIESALESYPLEPSLIGSRDLLRELKVSITVSNWIEKAESARAKGDNVRAARLYRDALFHLGRDNVRTPERDMAAQRIQEEIARLEGYEKD
jgi:hypothetical protein